MLEFIPASPEALLDVGCATGRFGAALKQLHPTMTIVGVEPDTGSAQRAAAIFDRVVRGTFPLVASSVE